jgi:hypothetical protein
MPTGGAQGDNAAQHGSQAVQALLVPYRGDGLTAVGVSTLVNNPQSDSPRCVQPRQ